MLACWLNLWGPSGISISIEQNWTELIFIGRTLAHYITTKVFNIIQRIVWTHHEGWNAITGTLVRWVAWISYGNQWKTEGSSNRKPHRIGGISSCQNDNTMCHQRRGSCQSDDPLPSVINNVFKLDSWKTYECINTNIDNLLHIKRNDLN